MIKPIASNAATLGAGKVSGVARTAAVKASGTVKAEAMQAPAPAAELAAAGPPVDASKVERIKAGIADGSYTSDAKSIAHHMVDRDLPPAK